MMTALVTPIMIHFYHKSLLEKTKKEIAGD